MFPKGDSLKSSQDWICWTVVTLAKLKIWSCRAHTSSQRRMVLRPETGNWNALRWSAPSVQLDLGFAVKGECKWERGGWVRRKKKYERNALEVCNYLERRQPPKTPKGLLLLTLSTCQQLQRTSCNQGEREWVGVFKEHFTTEASLKAWDYPRGESWPYSELFSLAKWVIFFFLSYVGYSLFFIFIFFKFYFIFFIFLFFYF